MVGKKLWLFMFSIMFFQLFGMNALAETAKPDENFQAYDLGTIVVSAEQDKVKDVAITNVITAEDIKATNSHTVAEALSHAPGVRVTTGAKNQAKIIFISPRPLRNQAQRSR